MSDSPSPNTPKTTPPAIEVLSSEFMTSESVDQIANALAIAQGSFVPAQQGATNPHFKKSYSDLADVWDVCRTPLAANNLAVVQCPTNKANSSNVTLVTQLFHKSGQWIRFSLTFSAQMSNPQNAGSVITYMKRYTLAGLLGIASRGEDDDGEAGAGRGTNGNSGAPQNTSAPAQKKQTAPQNTSTPTDSSAIPEAARTFCERFAQVTDEAGFRKLVASTKESFDDGTPEKKALSAAIKEAAKRLGIQPKAQGAAQ